MDVLDWLSEKFALISIVTGGNARRSIVRFLARLRLKIDSFLLDLKTAPGLPVSKHSIAKASSVEARLT